MFYPVDVACTVVLCSISLQVGDCLVWSLITKKANFVCCPKNACYKRLGCLRHCKVDVLFLLDNKKDWTAVYGGRNPFWVNHVKSLRYLCPVLFLYLLYLNLHIIVSSYLLRICLKP